MSNGRPCDVVASEKYEGSTVYRNAIDRDVNVIKELSFQKNINSVFPVTEISLRVPLTKPVHNFSWCIFELKIVTKYNVWEKLAVEREMSYSLEHIRIVVDFRKNRQNHSVSLYPTIVPYSHFLTTYIFSPVFYQVFYLILSTPTPV